jgi:hypothetical protein
MELPDSGAFVGRVERRFGYLARSRTSALFRFDRIQVAIGPADHVGRIIADPKKAVEAKDYVDKLLDHGLRALVGVSYSNGLTSVDSTAHYVCIYARIYDENRVAYVFMDPARRRDDQGKHIGVFYVDGATNKLYKIGRETTHLRTPQNKTRGDPCAHLTDFPPYRLRSPGEPSRSTTPSKLRRASDAASVRST